MFVSPALQETEEGSILVRWSASVVNVEAPSEIHLFMQLYDAKFKIRENFCKWVLDKIPLDLCRYLSQMDDDEFFDVGFGQKIDK